MAAAAVISVTENKRKTLLILLSVERMADITQQINLWDNRNVKQLFLCATAPN